MSRRVAFVIEIRPGSHRRLRTCATVGDAQMEAHELRVNGLRAEVSTDPAWKTMTERVVEIKP